MPLQAYQFSLLRPFFNFYAGKVTFGASRLRHIHGPKWPGAIRPFTFIEMHDRNEALLAAPRLTHCEPRHVAHAMAFLKSRGYVSTYLPHGEWGYRKPTLREKLRTFLRELFHVEITCDR